MRKREVEATAVAWALDEVEKQLREEPAHRLRRDQNRSWSLIALNEVGVSVEAIRAGDSEAAVEFRVVAGADGLLPGHARAERRIQMALDGRAAREPEVLYLVFETGGHVYAFESLEDAGDSLEGVDLEDYIAAFSDRGEVVSMSSGELWIEFTPTGIFDPGALRAAILRSGRPTDAAADPHRLALTIWYAT